MTKESETGSESVADLGLRKGGCPNLNSTKVLRQLCYCPWWSLMFGRSWLSGLLWANNSKTAERPACKVDGLCSHLYRNRQCSVCTPLEASAWDVINSKETFKNKKIRLITSTTSTIKGNESSLLSHPSSKGSPGHLAPPLPSLHQCE